MAACANAYYGPEPQRTACVTAAELRGDAKGRDTAAHHRLFDAAPGNVLRPVQGGHAETTRPVRASTSVSVRSPSHLAGSVRALYDEHAR
jgi:hypothetical protein